MVEAELKISILFHLSRSRYQSFVLLGPPPSTSVVRSFSHFLFSFSFSFPPFSFSFLFFHLATFPSSTNRPIDVWHLDLNEARTSSASALQQFFCSRSATIPTAGILILRLPLHEFFFLFFFFIFVFERSSQRCFFFFFYHQSHFYTHQPRPSHSPAVAACGNHFRAPKGRPQCRLCGVTFPRAIQHAGPLNQIGFSYHSSSQFNVCILVRVPRYALEEGKKDEEKKNGVAALGSRCLSTLPTHPGYTYFSLFPLHRSVCVKFPLQATRILS